MAGVLLYENPTRDIYHGKREFPADVHEQMEKTSGENPGAFYFSRLQLLWNRSLFFLKARDADVVEV